MPEPHKPTYNESLPQFHSLLERYHVKVSTRNQVINILIDSLKRGSQSSFDALIGYASQQQQCITHNRELKFFNNTATSVLERMEQSSTTQQKHGPQPKPNQIRYRLEEKDDYKTIAAIVKKSGKRGLRERIRAKDYPWSLVMAVNVEKRTLFLHFGNPADEARVRQVAGNLNETLGLSSACCILPEKYCVTVFDMSLDRSVFSNENISNDYLEDWAQDNKIALGKAYWSYGRLIWELDSPYEALALCNRTVWLSGDLGIAKPIDLRSIPELCYKCGKPGHMQRRCQYEPGCLRCGMNTTDSPGHNQWNCSNPERCLNCDEQHVTWSTSCEAPVVVKMMDECRKWNNAGPDWSWQHLPPSSDESSHSDMSQGGDLAESMVMD